MENTSSSAERQQFEAVWKRVTASTETSSGSPILPSVPSVIMDTKAEDSNLPEADDAVLIKQFIADETYILNSCRSLACKLRSSNFFLFLYRLCSQIKENVKKLQAAYFILTGDSFKAEFYKPPKGALLSMLYDLYWKVNNSAKAFETAAQNTQSNKLSVLFMTISAVKKSQADELEELIGILIK